MYPKKTFVHELQKTSGKFPITVQSSSKVLFWKFHLRYNYIQYTRHISFAKKTIPKCESCDKTFESKTNKKIFQQ